MTLMIRAAAPLAILGIIGAWTSSARADEVRLDSGTRLVGELEGAVEGKLKIQTGVEKEPIEVPFTDVQSLKTDDLWMVELASGRQLRGRFESPEDDIRLVTRDMGTLKVRRSAMRALWKPGAPSPKVAELEKKAESLRMPWSIRFRAGVQGAKGNAERVAVNGLTEAKRETPDDRLTLFLRGNYAREDGDLTQGEIIGGFNLEVDFTERWFAYVRSQLEHDAFEQLDLRATPSAGLGWSILQGKPHELRVRLGAGYRHESYQTGVTNNDAVGDAGYDYTLIIDEWLRFTSSVGYAPALTDPTDFRLTVDHNVAVPIGETKWSIEAGVRNQYNSEPQPDVEKLDTTYFVNVGFDAGTPGT
ncbi:MAG: DUF481 domain-containing protein [Myxococcota bacterium]